MHCQLSDKKAARKFHLGVGITKWETLKEKCIEFLRENPTIQIQVQSQSQSQKKEDSNEKMLNEDQNSVNNSLLHLDVNGSEHENDDNGDHKLTSSAERNDDHLLSIPPSSHSLMMHENEDSINNHDDDVYSFEYDLVDQTKSNDLE